MASNYTLEIEDKIDVNGMPGALGAFALASPTRHVLCALTDQDRIVFLKSGGSKVTHEIKVGAQPCDISRGAGGFAYIACREDQTVDVINQTTRVKRIPVPGRPYGLAWNGCFKRGKSRILVTCQDPNQKRGVVCVINEETLEITKTLPIGKHPRGICLDDHQKRLFIANTADDSISVIDQNGTKIIHKIATAGRPRNPVYSWAEPEHVIVCLQSGGVLQRLDTMQHPPELSGLTALSFGETSTTRISPADCAPLGQDHLWVATDQHSESLALVISRARQFRQIDCFPLGGPPDFGEGLGQIAIVTPGLPATFYVANLKRKQLILARLAKTKATARPRSFATNHGKPLLRSRSTSLLQSIRQ